MVREYRLDDGDINLSEHIMLHEMLNNSDYFNAYKPETILVDDRLCPKIEELISACGGDSVVITSGYRTPASSLSVGGYRNDRHTKGMAADIIIRKNGELIDGKNVACHAQDLGFAGIGYMGNSVHVDVDDVRIYRGDENTGGNLSNVTDFHQYFNIYFDSDYPHDSSDTTDSNYEDKSDMHNNKDTFDMHNDEIKNGIRADIARDSYTLFGRLLGDIDERVELVACGDISIYDMLVTMEREKESTKLWLVILYYKYVGRFPTDADLEWWYEIYSPSEGNPYVTLGKIPKDGLSREEIVNGFASGYEEFFNSIAYG